jgi:FkbM family methyltransferase
MRRVTTSAGRLDFSKLDLKQLGRLNMKIRKTLAEIRSYIRIVLRYRNCIEILAKTYRKQTITRVILRSGVQIDAPEDHPFLLGMTNETFFENAHTPVGLPIEANDVVVDIGANIGVVTLFAALRTQKAVHAFEPSPENVEFLNRNIRTNGIHNVIVHDVAVGDKNEKLTKLHIGDSVGHQLITCYACTADETERYIDVPCVTLKHIIDNIVSDGIGFLKIDCEGCEGLIFLSTPTDYLRRVKKIVVEFHNNYSPLKHDAIQRLLEEAGFETKLYWQFGEDSPYGYLYGKRD